MATPTFSRLAVAGLCAGVSGCNIGPHPVQTLQDFGGNEAVAASAGSSGGGGPVAPPGTIDFGSTRTQSVPPPPITGGTLLASHDGTTAIVADSDRDQVYLVDLVHATHTTLRLRSGDEPGRAVEDSAGRVHVAARRGGVLVTIDLGTRRIVDRRAVCAAPRGIGYDAPSDLLYVACATGELVTMRASGGPPVRTVTVDRDLRDVIVTRPSSFAAFPGAVASGPPSIFVSRLKTAELLTIGDDGAVLNQAAPPSRGIMTPAVAWRTLPMQNGQIAMVHQRGTTGIVSTSPGGYAQGTGCSSSVVESTVTFFTDGSPSRLANAILPAAVLPVDLAESRDGSTLAVVAAGNAFAVGQPSVLIFSEADALVAASPSPAPDPQDAGATCASVATISIAGQAVAAAFTQTALLVQSREPAALYVYAVPVSADAAPVATIALSAESRDDTGHDIFHSNSGAFVACASCHPEGLEDGRIWTFENAGPRRTQSLLGTLDGTAPYHWEGDLADIPALTQEVFVGRMSGPELADDQITALQDWLFTLPAPPGAAISASATRGQALFESPTVGCAACHSGPKYTNNATLDVQTGGSFQVPSLVGVAWRTPLLHDGCAKTLEQRFEAPCTDGVSHGQTAGLDASQIADLVSYLETL